MWGTWVNLKLLSQDFTHLILWWPFRGGSRKAPRAISNREHNACAAPMATPKLLSQDFTHLILWRPFRGESRKVSSLFFQIWGPSMWGIWLPPPKLFSRILPTLFFGGTFYIFVKMTNRKET